MKARPHRWRSGSSVLAVLLAAAAAVVAVALLAPGGARASSPQEMILQDDTALVYGAPNQVAATMTRLKNMGVDRVRISVASSLVAPDWATTLVRLRWDVPGATTSLYGRTATVR